MKPYNKTDRIERHCDLFTDQQTCIAVINMRREDATAQKCKDGLFAL